MSCQDVQLTLLVEDTATTVRLVERACIAMNRAAGGLTPDLVDPAVPGPASPEFRRLAKVGANRHNDAMLSLCAQMSPAQRRAAANTAADLVVGHLLLNRPGT